MLKKAIYGSVAAAIALAAVFGTDAVSYVWTGARSTQEAIRSEVPVEFEIERARTEISQILPEVKKSLRVIAEEQVAIRNLQESIAERTASLEQQKTSLLSLTTDLKSEESTFVYAGRAYSRNDVEEDLSERFRRFQQADQSLKQEVALLAAREKGLESHRKTVDQLLAARDQLEADLKQLEVRSQLIDSQKQIYSLDIDDSQLAKVESLIETINNRLDVEEQVLVPDAIAGMIPVEDELSAPNDIAQEVHEYFGIAEQQVAKN